MSVEDTEIYETEEEFEDTETVTSTTTVVNVSLDEVNSRLDGIQLCLVVIILILGISAGIKLGSIMWRRVK